MSMQAIQTSWRMARMVPMKTGSVLRQEEADEPVARISITSPKVGRVRRSDIAKTQNTKNA